MATDDRVGQMIPEMFPIMQIQKMSQTSVNSYNLNTTTTNYVFNTIFRDDFFNSNSNNCNFTLPKKLKNVTAINLSAMQFPNVASTFSDSKGTNVIYIAEDGTSCKGLVTLPSGNYAVQDFVDTLTLAINTQLNTENRFLVEVNPHNNRITITNSTNTFYMNLIIKKETNEFCNYHFNSNPGEIEVNKKKVKVMDLVSSMGYLMGYMNPEYTGRLSYRTESVWNDTFQDYVYVELNDYTGNQFESTVGMLPSGMINKNILSVMPIISAKLTSNFDSNANFIQKVRNYSAPVNIGKISMRILGPAGELMDLKLSDYMFVLQVTTLYDNVAPFGPNFF